MKALVIAALLGACVEAELVECEDGWACPSGTACDLVHHGCVAPDAIEACLGAAELAACTTSDIASGVCAGGVCVPAGCGNGAVEAGEVCDDGNTTSGDGCDADCASQERCGDGIVDRMRGEECDDANTLGRDGCSSACTVEDLVWREHSANPPSARLYSSLTYDPIRRRLVVFGGTDFTDGRTYELDGVVWTTITTPIGPGGRDAHATAFDPVRRRLVLFGGFGGGIQQDTWLWDGATWTRARPAVAPPARLQAAMAWDPIGRRVVLFGGTQLTAELGDTWAWDGSAWMQLAPARSPSPRRGAMVFDTARERLVLSGGGETWTFDGATWEPLAIASPPAMDWFTLAHDPARRVSVLTGHTASGVETWELGTSWTNRTPAIADNHDIVDGGVAAYDPERRAVVMFAGRGSIAGAATWTWNGARWTRLATAAWPAGRNAAAIASDPVRGALVMFGGTSSSRFGDTWEWNGRRWSQRAVLGPSPRFDAAMAYDGRGVVVVGGSTLVGDSAETWTFDGTRWALRGVGPAARHGAAIAYDEARDRVVLFGGRDAASVFADTWEWDGTAWHELAAAGPGARSDSALTYDAVHRRILLFGGTSDAGDRADTWAWDGTSWTQLFDPFTPEPRSAHAIVFDPARGSAMMFGGRPSTMSLWERKVAWSQPTSNLPPVHNGMVAAYGDAFGETVMFGGSAQPDTWSLATLGADTEVCSSGIDADRDGLVGCADPDCGARCGACGDGTCDPLEDDRLCPSDCTGAQPICGDGYRAPAESCSADP